LFTGIKNSENLKENEAIKTIITKKESTNIISIFLYL